VSDLVVASNRGPVSFELDRDGSPTSRHSAGGLAPSLASALRGSGATWVASALGEGDRAAAAGGGTRDVDGITLRLLDLPEEVQRTAYNVVANGTLWFLLHDLFELARRPLFDRHWHAAWEGYRAYNDAFAEAICEVAGPRATVIVHDYHLLLCGSAIARRRPDLRTVHFTHTPWCEPRQIDVLPSAVAAELVAGVAGHGACGFHTGRWAAAFTRCLAARAGTAAEQPQVPVVFSSPLGVDQARLGEMVSSPDCAAARDELLARTDGRRLLLRSDRVELSKNLVRGFRAYGELLEQKPHWRERVVFVALSYGSREQLPEYLAYRSEAEHAVELVNDRFATGSWTPVLFEVADDVLASTAALTCYDVLLVNPLLDGLNLVAKEGPLVNERDGVLALSAGAGAFEELGEHAVEVHPYDVVQTAAALDEALSMAPGERRLRALALRQAAARRTPASWLADLVAQARRPGAGSG
jgi:trehalose 6-phosphate synthase